MSPTNIEDQLRVHTRIMEQTVKDCSQTIGEIASSLVECFRQGNKVMFCGNGGSAADSQHIAAEFVNRFRMSRPALPAMALTVDTSILTSIANDSSFDFTFSRQVEALSKPGDILAALSTSGASPNILKALEAAGKQQVKRIGFTGEKGGETMAPLCDLCLVVPSADPPRIQEVHEFLWHVLCDIVEEELFTKD